ncbi:MULTISPECIES: agmatinase family protein [Pontibacillus]|uniref:Agmatinase family protein n=1 Tax=Pontibacillus chungwhensis TaxID=265426 RepID=A0ABY8V471_9BACI|nr:MULTISPECIES: agmatinase family protein [Pontibacillus]MCD5322355.1 agmatinase family protein [Pontibacillus sp. HN14]WIF99644.1 agmatinase family protein [Pontibacillus chungwhensis]
MRDYPYPQLERPSFKWNRATAEDPKVHEWIKTIPEDGEVDWSSVDVTLLGVPLSRSSISASAASENPDAMRRAWKSFSTYNIDYDRDLSTLTVMDLGDTRQHVTDIETCHKHITEAMEAGRKVHPHTLPLTLGGDHSITAMLIKGMKRAEPEERIGLLQFDTHFDLRDLETFGPANGTPVRNLIESGTIKGEDVYNIGLHGFFNGKSLKTYADQVGLNYVTMREARTKGIESVVTEAITELSQKVDRIYMTVDMDVLDITQGPAAPAATPGGMRTDELFEAVTLAGKSPHIKAMDIVCLDPTKDVADFTVKAAVHTMLSFLTGMTMRNT